MSKKAKIILIVLILLAVLGFVFYFSPLPNLALDKGEVPKAEGVKENNITFTNDIPGETSVYSFMDRLRSEGKITFTDKTYIGMGKMITSISGTKSNGSYTWIYYVNGKKAEIGISNYKINPDDVVSWKYEEVHY